MSTLAPPRPTTPPTSAPPLAADRVPTAPLGEPTSPQPAPTALPQHSPRRPELARTGPRTALAPLQVTDPDVRIPPVAGTPEAATRRWGAPGPASRALA